MADYKTYDFIAGDILRYQGKQFQVHENLGVSGLVAEYPAPEAVLQVVDWNDNYQKVGNEPLAKSSACDSCASTDCEVSPSAASPQPNQPEPIRILENE